MTDNLPGHTLSEYLKAVVEEAKKDGKVTADEYNIIKQLSLDVAKYLLALEEAERDGVIDQDERAQLLSLKAKLMDNAKEIANEDGVVTAEELALIKKITEIIEK